MPFSAGTRNCIGRIFAEVCFLNVLVWWQLQTCTPIHGTRLSFVDLFSSFTRSIIIFLYSIPILLEISTVIAGGCRSSCDDASSRAVVCTVIKKTPCLLDLVVLNCFSLNPLHTCEKYRFNEIKTGNAGPYIIESTVTLNYRSCSRV